MKFLVILCVAAGLAYCGYLGVLYVRQDSLVFPGRTTDTARVAEIRKYYKGLEDFEVKAPDGTRLRGYLLVRTRDGKPAPAILSFHGNAEEQSGFFLWSPSELSGFTVAGLNYRGYGTSEGKPSKTALKADALTAYDALAARLEPGVPVVVMGRSLGSGIAAYVAAHRDVAGVILVTPYDSLVDVGQDAHPFVPVSLLMRHRFDVAPDAARVKAPTLMLVAGADTLIPPRHAARLAALWAGPKEVHTVDNATHGNIIDNPQYWKHIKMFLDKLFVKASEGEETPPASRRGGTPLLDHPERGLGK
jgi:pimeloyl-ACP methyl ester carboxylesterase